MHYLDKFKYCPVCGSDHFCINDFKSKKCADCGFIYYFNPSAAVVAIIVNERNEILAPELSNRQKVRLTFQADLPTAEKP